MILNFFARIPTAAVGMTLTLHVAITLGRGYGAAGLVGAAGTVGIALGAPVMGRIVDRYGLRPMLVLTTIGEAAFWFTGPFMAYPVLLVTSFVAGVVTIPAMSIGRQAIAALVPEDQRRTAYSLDSVMVELCFMIGPVVGVALATQVSTKVAMIAIAGSVILVGVALYVVNPAVRGTDEKTGEPRPPRREWLTRKMIGVLVFGLGAIFVIAGTEVAVVAVLRAQGDVEWSGAVVVILCVASLIGGVVHGAVRKSLPQVVLMALLGLLTIPVVFFGGPWWVIGLALAPASAMCAPIIASTGEEVSRLAPVAVRGEATGLQSSAFTLGASLGSPVIGFVVDHTWPSLGFAAAGVGGLLVAASAFALTRTDQLTSASAIS
ncbi:putative MFS family arabinose efflux permease [Actinocrispum wychmicini]|uniref:Putative MFS family arabinose efflux permease n=2 Tax=Actinocrispum wychmicini TaxID=1213861 RepID=A0A4R2JYM0_9PSEU|nr:putative MFS family arabinose efflux permease [Actinocrispum wychmicini]